MIPHPAELGKTRHTVLIDGPADPVQVENDTPNKFCVDYSKRGTARCKICKNCIPKNELRMGAYTVFKGKTIIIFYHVACLFQRMRNARIESNVVQSSNEIDGFNEILIADQTLINELIKEENETRNLPVAKSFGKNNETTRVPFREKQKNKKLKMLKTPSIKVMFTNADQFTHAKKNELEQRIVTEKPMIVAVSEVNPKNGKDMAEADYSIDGYSIHPVNLDKPESGRGIVIYTHNSIDKSVIKLQTTNAFEESCLLEVRLRNGDFLLFGCIYRSPTQTSSSTENNDHLNTLLRSLCSKPYSHICLVGDFDYRKSLNLWKLSKTAFCINMLRSQHLFVGTTIHP